LLKAMLERLFTNYVDRNSNGLATQSELLTALDLRSLHRPEFMYRNHQKAVTSLLEEGSDLQLSALVDRDFRMRCPAIRFGKAEKFAWSRHGNGLGAGWRFSRRWTVHADDTLLLKSVTAADAGIYSVLQLRVAGPLCVTLALNVIARTLARPAPHPSAPAHASAHGRRASPSLLPAGSSGVDQIRWLYNSKPIEPRPDCSLLAMAQIRVSHLSIAKLGKHHTGLYTCSVSNKAGIAESAGSVYVRDATETATPLSPQLWTSVGPTPTKAVVFHSDGFAVLDFEDCPLKRPVAARLCGCHGVSATMSTRDNEDQQLDGECDWVGDSGGHLLAARGRLLFAALRCQQRLLAIESPAAFIDEGVVFAGVAGVGLSPEAAELPPAVATRCGPPAMRGRVLRLSKSVVGRRCRRRCRDLARRFSWHPSAGACPILRRNLLVNAGKELRLRPETDSPDVWPLACQTLTAAAEAKSTSERGYCCPTLSIEQTLFLHPQGQLALPCTAALHALTSWGLPQFQTGNSPTTPSGCCQPRPRLAGMRRLEAVSPGEPAVRLNFREAFAEL
uniref:Ig-like domain-containing protein n=1 Tax=Macrostomum lignano TaxID=282301 RepID=A0A1I8FM11_9PLAT